jgi:hypothetical protein
VALAKRSEVAVLGLGLCGDNYPGGMYIPAGAIILLASFSV